MTVCPSCKRRKASDGDWDYYYAHYGKLSPLVDAVCLQGDDCILLPCIRWWASPVEVSGPTGEDRTERPRYVPGDDPVTVLFWSIATDPERDPDLCPAPLPGERLKDATGRWYS